MKLAFPKLRYIRKLPAVHIFKDGREVCRFNTLAGRLEYQRRKRIMWERQKGKCFLCGKPLAWDDSTFEHEDGRGMNGAKRDDRIEKDGKPYNGAAHLFCNTRKGSMSLTQFLEGLQR